jgi:hypothetical protein
MPGVEERARERRRGPWQLFRSGAANVLAAALPLLGPFAYFWWLELSPKTWADPQCGMQGYVLMTAPVFFVVPSAVAAIRARRAGKVAGVAAALAVSAFLISAAGCVFAFFVWFGIHKCGE